ncbi:MAG TPA: SipW-dependent-type signal peptide-containing protein [Propionicimonas sp.]|nr:SipW-dependent-type signal peptide-containing protein [Propionicimonas sp.]
MPATMTDQKSSRRGSRKIAAVLAGGLVLGVGTMATLASWNDSEFASATFTAGKFIFEGAADQTTFSDHATIGTAAALTFTTPFSNMTPNDVVYAGYAVRLGTGTTNNATVTVTGTATGAAADYKYTMFTTAAAGCSASAVPVATIVTSNDLGAGTGSFAIAKNALATAPGATTYLCIKVTADPTLTQSLGAIASWQLQAVSN